MLSCFGLLDVVQSKFPDKAGFPSYSFIDLGFEEKRSKVVLNWMLTSINYISLIIIIICLQYKPIQAEVTALMSEIVKVLISKSGTKVKGV